MDPNFETREGLCRPEEEVVEVSFLLPGYYAAALESLAHSRGQTAGQVVRHLIRSFLHERPGT